MSPSTPRDRSEGAPGGETAGQELRHYTPHTRKHGWEVITKQQIFVASLPRLTQKLEFPRKKIGLVEYASWFLALRCSCPIIAFLRSKGLKAKRPRTGKGLPRCIQGGINNICPSLPPN